jgi:hypothetical protein
MARWYVNTLGQYFGTVVRGRRAYYRKGVP